MKKMRKEMSETRDTSYKGICLSSCRVLLSFLLDPNPKMAGTKVTSTANRILLSLIVPLCLCLSVFCIAVAEGRVTSESNREVAGSSPAKVFSSIRAGGFVAQLAEHLCTLPECSL